MAGAWLGPGLFVDDWTFDADSGSKTAMFGQLPDTIKFNYEKYGILGITGVIVLTIIILTNIKLFNINNIITLTRL